MVREKKLAAHQIINWVWFLRYSQSGLTGRVEIYKHWRRKLGTKECSELLKESTRDFRLHEEGEHRGVIAVEFDSNGIQCKVVNPKGIFDYGKA